MIDGLAFTKGFFVEFEMYSKEVIAKALDLCSMPREFFASLIYLWWNLSGYHQPWEDGAFDYPDNFAHPLDIIIEASNGASDYGNKFGEPVLTDFARSFGIKVGGGERREWVKPIMFSGGIGMMDGKHVNKSTPEKGEAN